MTAAIQDVVAAVRDLLEPAPHTGVTVDPTGAEPLEWEPDTLYVYVARLVEVPFETGPTRRQDFTITAVLPVESDEDARQERRAAITDELDTKLGSYLAAVRVNQRTPTWDHLQAAQRPAPRTIKTRSVAIDMSGYRFV